ncbi:hypothetical protein [Verrucomicrobium spinosum]|uniref:hypothetical protein n=1 Tax=Verrucomicrobium spinosum TaxID=2736 RepID=UPI00155D9519|nr:hypothetical protein [Verrucomicrobium spinosum]
MSEPTVAIVTKARGTFFKPLYEAFAQAQPEAGARCCSGLRSTAANILRNW